MPTPDLKPYAEHFLGWLDTLTRGVPVSVIIQPGQEVAWDFCAGDCGGMGYVRIVQAVPVYGDRKANGKRCVVRWDVTWAVGVLRCVAGVDDRGHSPAPVSIMADGLIFLDDFAELMAAAECDPFVDTVVQGVPLGPQGGCAGGEVLFNTRLAPCCPEGA